MSHPHHPHCKLDEQVKKFKAGKLGLLGSLLIVGHLLFHVAECLIVPAIIVAIGHHDASASEELSSAELPQATFDPAWARSQDYHIKFTDALEFLRPLH